MWNYLRSDFEELISVVKEDSHVILEKLHDEKAAKKATAASKEAERRMFMEETYILPLIYEEMDDAERAVVEKFINEFNVDDKTDEISGVLEDYEIVKEYFEALVPQEIRYEEFWSRYFYRCDEVRIQAVWDAQEVAAQLARAELVGSVSSFFGGAAKSLASTVKEVVSQKDGRPPFVMNTAVDEDEEDEEEELGWDDEEEEDEEVEVKAKEVTVQNPLEDPDTEEIEFHDEVLETTKEELKQAVMERDLLQQTVELLKKELVNIKAVPEASSSSFADATVESQKDKEIEKLREALAQMTKTTAVTLSSDDEATAKIQELTHALAAKDREYEASTRALRDEIIALRTQLDANEARAKEVDTWKHQCNKSSEAISSLNKQVADLHSKLDMAQGEIHQLRADAERHHDSGKSSEDSGVPIEPPLVATKLDKNDDESDGWGDEWE